MELKKKVYLENIGKIYFFLAAVKFRQEATLFGYHRMAWILVITINEEHVYKSYTIMQI